MKSKKAVNIAASFRARLLNLARERNEDFHFVLSRWMIERFLYRLSISPHKDSFVLKGAMLFAAWTGKVYRPTRDLDLLGYGSPNIDRLVTAFRQVCTIDGADGLLFEPGRIEGERIRQRQSAGRTGGRRASQARPSAPERHKQLAGPHPPPLSAAGL